MNTSSVAKWVAISFFGGATAFWFPDLLLNAFYRGSNTAVIEAGLTIACPAALICFYTFVRRRSIGRNGLPIALCALAGVWLLGLTFIMLSRTIGGGGFRDAPFGWTLVRYFLISSLIPTRTFGFAMLDGTAGGIVVGTVAMLFYYFRSERKWRLKAALPQ